MKIELSYDGDWFGYPITLWPNEDPENRVREYQIAAKGIIRWREWQGQSTGVTQDERASLEGER